MRTSKGFSLIELMIAIAVLATITSIGVPAFRDMILNNRIVTTSNTVLSIMQLARSEAVTQRRNITVCPSNDQVSCTTSNWQDGILVTDGTTPIRLVPASAEGISIISTATALTFTGNGTLSGGAQTFSVEDSRGSGVSSRNICINLVGQTRSVRGNVGC
jgi:type IV fimbrial biogenesis protein FimT